MSYNEENIKLSETWFILAQILAVIAGLFVVAAGFLITPPSQAPLVYQNGLNLCNTLKISELNVTNPSYKLQDCLREYGELYITKINNSNINGNFLFALSILLAINSLACWLRGRYRIRHPLSEDMKFGPKIIILNLITVVILYLGIK